MTSSKFSASRATKSTLYSLSSPFQRSSSKLSNIVKSRSKRTKPSSSSNSSSATQTQSSGQDSDEDPATTTTRTKTNINTKTTASINVDRASPSPRLVRAEQDQGQLPVQRPEFYPRPSRNSKQEQEPEAEAEAEAEADADAANGGVDGTIDPLDAQERPPLHRVSSTRLETFAQHDPAETESRIRRVISTSTRTPVTTSPALPSPVDVPQQQQQARQHPDPEEGKATLGDEPVLRSLRRKSRTWADRLSMFLPSSLIDQPADHQARPSSSHLSRKPLPNHPDDGDHPSLPYQGIRPSATFDLGFSPPSNADLSLHNPQHIAHMIQQPPPASPPGASPITHHARGPSQDLEEPFVSVPAAPTMAPPPVPPPKHLTKDRQQPHPPHPPHPPRTSSREGLPENARLLRKENRQSPPSIAPPPPPPPPTKIREPELQSPAEENQSRGRLTKEAPETRQRSSSHQARKSSFPVMGIQHRATSPAPDVRGRSTSAQPPPGPTQANMGSRVASTPTSVNSQSPTRDEKRGRLRRSWLPGGRSRSNSQDLGSPSQSSAWMLGQDPVGEYKTSFLLNGEKVPELWNESGAVLVSLFPRNSGCGPSFKVPIYAISSSQVFNDLIQAEMVPERSGSRSSRTTSFSVRGSLTADDARVRAFSPPSSPSLEDGPQELLRLYLPGAASPPQGSQLATPGQQQRADFDRLVALRNLFAFLTGQPLVATKAHPTTFSAFLEISGLLHEFYFTDLDGSNFGEAVDMSFGFFNSQLGLSDVRHSREKTLEALVLGERMRSKELYDEAFAHAVGKYTAIMDLKSPLFDQVSAHTRQKLERAHLDLVNRQHNVNMRLETFDFPSLFSGIANSNSIAEVRNVRFSKWRNSFNRMRQFVMSYYKANFGNWPPKASSKKNPFSESGLNRLVLKALYSDMCALYDLLVDRESLTPRVIHGGNGPEEESPSDSPMISALRKVLTEYDNSTPPVLPPIPFDVPQLPSMRAVLETYDKMPAKEQAKFDKRIKEHELILVLHKAYNYDTNTLKVPFLAEFKDFEQAEARGKNAADLADQRIGYWLFLYVVIQSLPMLVIDAPGLQHTEGVEYFLCEPPMGNPPWLDDARQVRKMWYEVSGGAGYVELSADSVMFSVEAIYHRSHCWAAAKMWEGGPGAEDAIPTEPVMSPLAPPPMFTDSEGPIGGPPQQPLMSAPSPSPPPGSPKYVGRPRNASPGAGQSLGVRNSAYRSSIAIGLEPVPVNGFNGLPGDRTSRVISQGSSLSDGRSLGSLQIHPGLPRSASASNLRGQGAESPVAAPKSTMTFDDILGGTEKKNAKKKKGKFF